MKIFYRKIKHFNWTILILITAIDVSYCCNRIPEGSVPDKSPADGRYIITISGSPQRYEPGQQYNISLQGIMAASSAHTFIGFYLAVESENGDPFNATDPLKAGTFELFDSVETEFSPRCRNLITNTNLTPKTKITVSWIAPRPGSGCVLFKATVIEHNKVWYMDDGTLTKQFCEEQTDDIENLPPVLSECCACDEAKYELTFEGRWSRHTHPKDFPANQWETRFSDIIGASHSKEHLFWKYGDYASEGLREVAEHGSTRKLESELKENSEHIRTIIKARGIAYPNVTGKTFAVFRVDPEHHLISLVSQIYPSPDWIVGVSALELCLPNCTWVQHKVHNLYPWDAGTDGGTSYMSPDQPLLHQEPIRRITSRAPYKSPFYDPSGLPMEPLARLHITQRRLYEKNCDDSNTRGDSPVECATHPWSKWSECSSKCGPGTRYRSRQYKNPAIATRFGKCNLQLSQTQDCTGQCKQEQFIPTIDTSTTPECDVTDWSEWSECSTSCGKGRMTRTRKFKTRKGHKLCKELNLQLEQTIDCENNEGCAGEIGKEAGEQEEEIPAECQVFDWSNWSPCSCDERNVRTRVREVRLHNGYRGSRNPSPCEHIQTEEEVKCHSSDCEKTIPDYCYSSVEVDTCRDGETSGYWYYDYTVDSCAMFFIYACQNSDTIENKFNSKKECEKTCRPRTKHNRNKEGLQSESLRFENYVDKVDCKLSDWTVHACNATCGEGYQIKTRKVLVTAKHGGKPCPKKLVRIEKCFVRCADEYSESYKRRRPLSSSLIEEDGSADGASIMLVQTTEEPCIYSEWSIWSPCTERCGENSIRQRTRTVLNANISHKCRDRIQTERCNVPPCLLARRQCTGPYCW